MPKIGIKNVKIYTVANAFSFIIYSEKSLLVAHAHFLVLEDFWIMKCVTRVLPETLYHRDDALLHIAYVMLIWAAPIPADRWHCSLWP